MEVKNLAAVLLFSLMTAGLGLLFQVCQEKGMIFRKYRNLIKFLFWLPKNNIGRGGIYLCKYRKKWSCCKVIFNSNKFQWLYKILGGCIYCNGTWIAILFYSICFYDTFDIRLLFLCIGGNYLWLELWLKIKE